MLEERVVVTVYPPGVAQAVLVATANGIEAFPNMASSITATFATLTVDLGERV